VLSEPEAELVAPSHPPKGSQFTTTHWSVVLAAGKAQSAPANAALEQLCRTYWHPLYLYVRRQGFDQPDAQDLTQEFFARLLDHQWLNSVAPEKGRFRTFLLTALDHFLANDWRRGQALKRGGGRIIVSLQETEFGEERFSREPATQAVPERAFDKLWATTVLDQAMTRLLQEFSTRGKSAHFEEWKLFLSREATAQDCQSSGQRLGMSPGATTVAIHRFRERYGDLLRETVAQTISETTDVDEELRYLFAVLRG
jgi:RNA polymerase sigma-70 factor (ECF subfamily)